MESIYTDFSIENQLCYKVIEYNGTFKVSVFSLDTDSLLMDNIYDGNLDDCIKFITIKITK